MKNSGRRYKPSLWWLALAPVIVVVGVGTGLMLILGQVMHTGTEISFVAPMSRMLDLDQAGTYVLSHDYKTVFRGRKYDYPAELPDGVEVSLKGREGEIEMQESLGSGKVDEESGRKEIGRFKIDEPGSYMLSVSGLPESRVLTFSESAMARIVLAAIAGLLLNLIGWFGGPALVITVFAKREINKRKFKAENPEEEA